MRPVGAKDCSPDTIKFVRSLHSRGEKNAAIARLLQLHPRTVSAIIARNGLKKKRTGRPPVFKGRLERALIREVNKKPTSSSTELLTRFENIVQCTPRTIRNTLKRNKYHCRIMRRKPLLTKTHKEARLRFALRYYKKSAEFWNKIVFSDESRVSSYRQWRRLVYRQDNTAYQAKHICATVRHNGASALFWGAMSVRGVGPLVHITERMTSDVYVDILARNLKLPRGWIFQHDNDPKHTARRTKEWLKNQKIRTLDWPANSPDLNPIEHLWAYVKRRVESERVWMRQDLLFSAIEREWKRVPREYVKSLVESMQRRLIAVIKARGGASKY